MKFCTAFSNFYDHFYDHKEVQNMIHTFDYFYGKESDQFNFIRIPKLLFTDKAFSDLSNDAKILYALMLDRMALSRQNEWFDEKNRVYIIFTIEEAAEMMSCGNEKIIKLFKELDDNTGIGLITRKRRGLGKPSIIYVRNFVLNDNSVRNNDNNNDQNQDIGKTEVLKSENPNSRDLKNRITDIGKSECINTEYNKTEMNHTDNQSKQSDCKKIPKEIQRNKFSASDKKGLIDRIKKILPSNNFSYEQIQSIYNLASVISESNDENKIMKHLAFLWTRMQDYKYNRKNEYRYFLNVINNAGPIKNSPDIVQKTKINMKSKPSYDLDEIFEYALNSTPVITRSIE